MYIIQEVLENIYNNESLRRTVVPLFISNPGMGKSQIIYQFGQDKGVNVVELITSQMSPFEISGIAMPDKELKKMTYYNFDNLDNLKDGDILFFDELLNGNPNVLNACLTILEQRKMISGKPLPDIMIVAAANPQGMVPLTPQIKERFVWYHLKFDKDSWIDWMIQKYDITRNIGKKLADLILSEDFTGDNFYTPRSVAKAVNMLINGVSTPYKNKVLTILEELITNTTGQEIKLDDVRNLMPDETIKWIDLARYKKTIVIQKKPKKKKVESMFELVD